MDADPDRRLYLRGCMNGLAVPPERVLEAADGLDAVRLGRAMSTS